MSEQKKFLDASGVKVLWDQISMQDYPNNATLMAVINAIDATKADRAELPEEPLKGTTLEITPVEVFAAMSAGRPIFITHTDPSVGACVCNYFVYNDALDSIISSVTFYMGLTSCVQLIGSLTTNEWVLNISDLIGTNNIDSTLTQSGSPADAKAVGDMLQRRNETRIVDITTSELSNQYTIDETFLHIQEYIQQGYNVVVQYEEQLCHLIMSIPNVSYIFQGQSIFIIIGTNNEDTIIEIQSFIDTTLSTEGMAADAKAVGEAITNIQLTPGPKGDKGDKGDTGSKGDTGDPGYSPVRGTDYWTDADKAEIKAYVDEAILGGAW